jgi:MFS family permease
LRRAGFGPKVSAAMRPGAKITVAAACMGWLLSAVDIVLLILFQRQVAEGLGVDPQTVRISIGVGLLGSALGGVALAQLGDRIGRVSALAWSVALYSLATGGMGLAPNVGTLMALRFVAGVGTGGEWSVGFALIAEAWPRGGRGRVGGVVAAMFNVGTFLAIGLYQSGIGWRWSFGLMALPALGVMWLRRVVPESPVWLALQEARREGRVPPELEASIRRPPLVAVLHGPLLGVTVRATLVFTLMNFAFYALSTVFINYLQHDPAGGGLGLSPRDEMPFQLAMTLAAMVGVVTAGALSDVWGRRRTFTAYCVAGAIGFSWLHSLTAGAAPGGGAPPGLLAAFAVVCAAFGINGIMGVLAPELYPTHLRATGPGLCQNLGKGIGGMAGPPVAGALVPVLGFPLVLALPGVLFVALALLIWTLPKVGGREVRPVEGAEYLDRT